MLLCMTDELVATGPSNVADIKIWQHQEKTMLQEWPPAFMTGFKHLLPDDSADVLHDLLHAPVLPVNQSITLMWDQC